MKVKHIKFENPPNHINKFLTHWTGRTAKDDNEAFNRLSQIIKSRKLRFSSCNNGFYYDSGKKMKGPMICFTDTPIEQSLEHCQRYNYFGISFNKEKLIECGANPVLYMVENRKQNQEVLFDFTIGQGKFQNNDEWRAIHDYFYRNNELHNKFSWFLSMTQPYKTEKVVEKGFAEYLEREWRIIRIQPLASMLEESIKIGGNYNEPFKSKLIIDNEGYSCLPFDYSFIENVIVLDKKEYIDKCKKLMKDVGLTCDLLVVPKTELKKIAD
jgi:hypothetical protein